jgi:hypothetical protein
MTCVPCVAGWEAAKSSCAENTTVLATCGSGRTSFALPTFVTRKMLLHHYLLPQKKVRCISQSWLNCYVVTIRTWWQYIYRVTFSLDEYVVKGEWGYLSDCRTIFHVDGDILDDSSMNHLLSKLWLFMLLKGYSLIAVWNCVIRYYSHSNM